MDGQEEIDVPYHFVCPISLQLMRDPVTVSTGITYDRHSIEAWLFSCRKRSCPVTNQPLGDSTFLLTPNLTLRRLIHSWCSLNDHSVLLEPRVPAPSPPLDASELLRRARAADPADTIDYLNAIRSSAAEGGDSIRKRLQSAGAIEHLAAVLLSDAKAVEISLEALSHLAMDEPGAKRLVSSGAMDLLAAVAGSRGASRQARTQAAALLLAAVEVAEPERLSGVSSEVFSI